MYSSFKQTFELLDNSNNIINFSKPSIMGIVNMSPNSFYQPYLSTNQAVDAIAKMIDAGVDMIDIGGEATNPRVNLKTAKPGTEEEINRIIPLLEAVKKRFSIWVSIDTSNVNVMKAALEAGADMINDQRSLRAEGALETIVSSQSVVCLMHFFQNIRIPASSSPQELLQQVQQELTTSITRCLQAGIENKRIIIDPGFGQGNYGKNCIENYYLLANLNVFTSLGYPVLVGWSRKSMIGDVLSGAPADQRLAGSLAAATLAAMQGAAIIRVHDVHESIDAIKVVRTFQAQQIS